MDATTDRAGVRWGEGLAWLAVTGAATAGLVLVRARIGTAHVALGYLLIVLVASSRNGRRVGLLLATTCFLAFNVLFVPPYGTLAVHDPLDWLVLLAFLATGALGAQLLHRAQREAAIARLRAREMQRLASLGAEAIQAPRAEEAAAAIAQVIRDELKVRSCTLYHQDEASGALTVVAQAPPEPNTPDAPRTAAELLVSVDARALVVPLAVRGKPAGILLLRSDAVIPPNAADQPFARALAYYAALGLERIRLGAAAAHADALREADRIKDAMLSAVSHDLRTPLTAIKALAHDMAVGGDARAVLVEEEADRLNRYVSNLLDLSRLNGGALVVTPELVPADDLLGVALREVAPLAKGRALRVTPEGDPALLVARADFVLALRTVTNVIENALRHSPDGEPVDVAIRRRGERLQVDVSDRGPGVRPEERERIFEPFQRGDQARDAQGVGLGLAIARRLAEAQGGTLTYADRAGGGATFRLELPAAGEAGLRGASL